jgi:SNF2 family DNA or RNA helicase
MLTAMISPPPSAKWALYVNVKCAPRSKRYNLCKSNLNLNNSRLHSDNAGADEWSTHCRGCVPLAKEAQRAERDRPSSAKIRKILQLLKEIDERSEGEEKTIIFSQFTSMLDLIEPFLNEKGIKYVRCELVLLEMFCNFSLKRR